MASEQTLTIIKPDGVEQNVIGEIIRALEGQRFRIVALKMVRLNKKEAEGFYAVHRDQKFFGSLTDFMCSGRIVVMVLEAENAIERLRQLMGATNPAEAQPGTLRKRFATSIERNVVHGSDAAETAALEIAYFFAKMQIVG